MNRRSFLKLIPLTTIAAMAPYVPETAGQHPGYLVVNIDEWEAAKMKADETPQRGEFYLPAFDTNGNLVLLKIVVK